LAHCMLGYSGKHGRNKWDYGSAIANVAFRFEFWHARAPTLL